jgi:membrane associated rhomboid family serine protease
LPEKFYVTGCRICFFNHFLLILSTKKMARSHHRKKHKQHLQQFKHSQVTAADTPKNKTSAIWVFGIAGAILGFAVCFFATSSSIMWGAAGLVVGAVAGYFLGRKIDSQKTK